VKKKKRRQASDSDDESDTVSNRDRDSGYNSGSDSVAEFIHQNIAKFKEAGPVLANHGESAEIAKEIEERNWGL
jgi:hypothetical protein